MKAIKAIINFRTKGNERKSYANCLFFFLLFYFCLNFDGSAETISRFLFTRAQKSVCCPVKSEYNLMKKKIREDDFVFRNPPYKE